MAFFGAIGTFINESGTEYILLKTDILGAGSINGFARGKFYNRCYRIHEMIALALENIMNETFLDTKCSPDLQTTILEIISNVDSEDTHNNPVIRTQAENYDSFFYEVINGSIGATVSYWAIYVYLIAWLFVKLHSAVQANDIEAYTAILPRILDVFFSLKRPNYALWGTLLLFKLRIMDDIHKQMLQNDAFSIRGL